MNSQWFLAGLIFFAAALHSSSTASEPGVITDLRANVRPYHSRLTFFFQGSIQFSSEYRGSTVVLRFIHTQVVLASSAEELRFSSGPIERVIVSRIADESIEVSILLREKASYSLVQPQGKNVLHLDVVSELWSDKARSGVPVVAGKFKGSYTNGQLPSPLLNIARIGWDQMSRAQENGSVSIPETHALLTRTDRFDEPVVPSGSESPGKAMTDQREGKANPGKLRPLFIIACVTLTGWLGMWALFCLVSEARPKRAVRTRSTLGTPSNTGEERRLMSAYGGSLKPQNESLRGKPEPADDNTEDAAASVWDEAEFDTESRLAPLKGLAERLLCDRGEVELAFKLQKEGLRHSTIDKIQNARLQHASRAQRVKAARKLEIGMGEIELAVRLNQLQHSNIQKVEFA